MTVYAVYPLVSEYQSLSIDPIADSQLSFVHDKSWPTPPVYVDATPPIVGESADSLPEPDIWYDGRFGMLVFASETVERLAPFLSLAGELLPLHDASGTGHDFLLLAIKGKERDRVLDTSVGYERRLAMLDENLSRSADSVAPADAEALRAEVVAGCTVYPYLAPAFIADELGDALTFFRVRGLHRHFVLDRDDADDSLLRRITALRLTGVATVPVWSSTSGHRDINLYAL